MTLPRSSRIGAALVNRVWRTPSGATNSIGSAATVWPERIARASGQSSTPERRPSAENSTQSRYSSCIRTSVRTGLCVSCSSA